MKYIILILALLLSNHLTAEECDNPNLQKYSYDIKSAVISGTGFKFTDRVGVTATFSSYKLVSKNRANSLEDLLKKTRILVDLNSIDSKNEVRDKNLKSTLFLHLTPVEIKVKDVIDDKLFTILTLNGVTKEVIFIYEIIDNRVIAKADIDVLAFNMENNIKSLKLKCRDLHIGSDGISKTWSDFDLKLEVSVNKYCD